VGGAVSVAVGSSFAALGTDAGGSIRTPASINGIVGLKPTFGRISQAGIIPPSGSVDTVGPLARTVDDAAVVFQALLADVDNRLEQYRDRRPAATQVRLGAPSYFFGPELDGEHRSALEEALVTLTGLGAEVVPVELRHAELITPAWRVIYAVESAVSHRRWLRERGDDYNDGTRRALLLGSIIPASHLQTAQAARSLIRQELRDVFEAHGLNALVGPTLPQSAIRLETMDASAELWAISRYTVLANLIGLPSLSVPCGATLAGIPIGMMLTGRPFGEPLLLSIGAEYERATSWHKRSPLGAMRAREL
jgi:aspartyl-tRNA(Asn)/glutamyl-tRNA(Gln) amidotransferase subunit A